ncbi:MAG: STT3 domain-containing protein [bacterium]
MPPPCYPSAPFVRSTPVDRRIVPVLVFVAALSWTTRELQHQKIPLAARNTWITSDKDSLYHMRRVERMFHEGLPGSDPYLSFPQGSAIPWPPYYSVLAWTWTAPAVPADPALRHDAIERRVASLPRACGVATAVLAALAANALAGPAAALFAGSSYALSIGSIVTSRIGNGDHHAFIAMLAAAMLLLMSRALRTDRLADPRGSALRGAWIGALAGVALGAWVASVLFIIPLQIALGYLVIRHSRRPIPGLPAFGLAFHAAALVTLLPAVIASPWKAAHPWMVVNLAWFHPVWLLAGALVFVPLLRLRPGPNLRAYPATVAAVLAFASLLLFALNVGPAAGLREGMTWLRRDDVFMGAVWESRGLFGAGAAFNPFEVLGFEILALPLAWIALALLALRRDRFELLPYVASLPLLAAQAARQVRFSDLLAMPMAVGVGWALVAAWGARPLGKLRKRVRALGRARDVLLAILLLGLVAADQASSVGRTKDALARDPRAPGQDEEPSELVVRDLCDWIRGHTPTPADYSVLASWTWGHVIEWSADRPTVSTNFGTFVGPEDFRDPSRFFLSEDAHEGEAILEKHRARYVIDESWLPNQLDPLIRAVDPSKRSRYIEPGGSDNLALRFEWYSTLGARLLFEGRALAADGSWSESVDFLRVVHATETRDPRYQMMREPPPAGWVWEHVPGALVEGRGAPGDTLAVELTVHYEPARWDLPWSRSAVCGVDGRARVRVPYATDGPNGDGVAEGPAHWRLGRRAGEVTIPEQAVMNRGVIRLGG